MGIHFSNLRISPISGSTVNHYERRRILPGIVSARLLDLEISGTVGKLFFLGHRYKGDLSRGSLRHSSSRHRSVCIFRWIVILVTFASSCIITPNAYKTRANRCIMQDLPRYSTTPNSGMAKFYLGYRRAFLPREFPFTIKGILICRAFLRGTRESGGGGGERQLANTYFLFYL